jgi:polyisoprenyl-phosphate glycosyltransferase
MPMKGVDMASLAVLIPSFNDWDALRLLLPRVDRALRDVEPAVSVLVVDDASTEPVPEDWPGQRFPALQTIEILHLRGNMGHQRAIALGLYHLHEFTDAEAVIIMDGDGEDRAEDLPALLAEFENGGGAEVVFAARTKRCESIAFQFFYQAYRLIHHVLTGVEVRVGNFSVVPRAALRRLTASADLWNHYAAAVLRARLPRRLLPLARGPRLAGESKMNFVSLLVHGLTAMSVFSDQVSARLLAASAGFAVLAAALMVAAVCVRMFTDLAIPGWTTYTIGALLGLVVQCVTFTILFAFMIASRRNSVGFILQRDAAYFILGRTAVQGNSQIAELGRALDQAKEATHERASI